MSRTLRTSVFCIQTFDSAWCGICHLHHASTFTDAELVSMIKDDQAHADCMKHQEGLQYLLQTPATHRTSLSHFSVAVKSREGKGAGRSSCTL